MTWGQIRCQSSLKAMTRQFHIDCKRRGYKTKNNTVTLVKNISLILNFILISLIGIYIVVVTMSFQCT